MRISFKYSLEWICFSPSDIFRYNLLLKTSYRFQLMFDFNYLNYYDEFDLFNHYISFFSIQFNYNVINLTFNIILFIFTLIYLFYFLNYFFHFNLKLYFR
jgi:hypothetical protein